MDEGNASSDTRFIGPFLRFLIQKTIETMPPKATVPVGSPGARGADPSSPSSSSQRGGGGGGGSSRRGYADAAAATANVMAAATAAIVTAAATAAANAAQAAVLAPVIPLLVTPHSVGSGSGGGGGRGAASLSAGAKYNDCSPEFHSAFDLLSSIFHQEFLLKFIEPLPVQATPGFTIWRVKLPLTKAELIAEYTDQKAIFLLNARS